MPTLIERLTHRFIQLAGPLLGEAESHLNVDDILPAPKWNPRQVDPGRLWRGAEPKGSTWDRWSELAGRGIVSVVSLQKEEASEAAEAAPYGIKTLHVPMDDNTPPTLAQVATVLGFVTKQENQPAYIHCRAGKGRTGVMVACYRVAVQGWSVDAAVAEARSLGMVMDTQEAFIRSFAAKQRAASSPR